MNLADKKIYGYFLKRKPESWQGMEKQIITRIMPNISARKSVRITRSFALLFTCTREHIDITYLEVRMIQDDDMVGNRVVLQGFTTMWFHIGRSQRKV